MFSLQDRSENISAQALKLAEGVKRREEVELTS